MHRIQICAIAKLKDVTPAGTWRDEYKNRTGLLLMREISGHLAVYYYPYCAGKQQQFLQPSSGTVFFNFPKITVKSKNSVYEFDIDDVELTPEQKIDFFFIKDFFSS